MEKFEVLGIERHRMKTDGRGVTTLVALAGCPLSCRYCINAELLRKRPHAKRLGPEELTELLAIDHCYFLYTNGGVTFGGGEPLLHAEQLAAFAKVCPPEWNITLETSLYVKDEVLEPFLTGRFSFIVDVKAIQPDIYRAYTGRENGQVLQNLQRMAERLEPKQFVVKLPRIPGYSDAAKQKEARVQLKAMGILPENILEFVYQAG